MTYDMAHTSVRESHISPDDDDDDGSGGSSSSVVVVAVILWLKRVTDRRCS